MRGKITGLGAALATFLSPAYAQAAESAAQTAPYLVDADQISSGDTAWMLTSTALVLLMTLPGLALFYGGMVRKKNVLSVIAQCFLITGLVTILWVIFGYSQIFGGEDPGGCSVHISFHSFVQGLLQQRTPGR
jgi:Amt family ammonium transporter